MNEIDNSLVTVGQPVAGACCWTSFVENPTLPTDAVTKMSTLKDFDSLGSLSENGLTESKSVTSNKFKDWGGSVVLTSISDEEVTFKLEFIEINRLAVAKLRYGSENVVAGEDGSVASITGATDAGVKVPLVIDSLESNGYLRRLVIYQASIDSFDDITYQKGSLVVYGLTLTASVKDGKLFTIYRAKPKDPTPPPKSVKSIKGDKA